MFTVKGRPTDHPVIAHIASVDELDRYADDLTDAARILAAACWPGPLTLVVRLRVGSIVPEVTGGRATVALRVPSHPLALALLTEFGGAIAAPSANRFGRVSPTTAAHVRADLDGDVDYVLDGGPTTIGVESTIVDCSRDRCAILRLGGIDPATVATLVGYEVERLTQGEIAAPGTLARHYSPAARVVVVDGATVIDRAQACLDRGERVGVLALRVETDLLTGALPAGIEVLSPPADVDEYARVLYARLREADEHRLDVVIVVPPPAGGIGSAVADRLARAAVGGRIP